MGLVAETRIPYSRALRSRGAFPRLTMPAELPYITYIAVLLLSSLSVLTTLLGVALAIYIGRNERAIAVGIGFSAGIMLLVSFLELMPGAIGEAGTGMASRAFMLGMLRDIPFAGFGTDGYSYKSV